MGIGKHLISFYNNQKVNILNKNSVIDLIYSIKNASLLFLFILFPYHLYNNSMKLYIFPAIIISFEIIYYLSYIMSRNIIELVKKYSVFLGGAIFAIIMPFILYIRSYLILVVMIAILAFGGSIIDNWNNTYRRGNNITNVYTGIALAGIFATIYFIHLNSIYIIFILSVLLGIFSIIYILFTHQNINYKKTVLTKKLKRYIVSIGDIKRVRNGLELLYTIFINSLLYMAIALILITIPLLAVKAGDINLIYRFVVISTASFFTVFLGSMVKSKTFQGISFVSIFPLLIVIGFLISIKNTPLDLNISILFIPAVAFLVPGYRTYITRKFPGSEKYYVNKFTNFFSGIFLITVPFIILTFIGFPMYAIIVELLASLIALIMCLKFINYPEIIPPAKYKN